MTKTEIVNMAFNRVGATVITDYDTSTQAEARTARLHYDQTVKSLLETFDWPFARGMAQLSESTDSPDFRWDNQFLLPNDFLKTRQVYLSSDFQEETKRWQIVGQFLMTNDGSVDLEYVRNIDAINEYDPLFTEVLILQLALKFIPPVAGTNTNVFKKGLEEDLFRLLKQVRTSIKQANNNTGRRDWNNARYTNGNRIDSQLGS